MANDLLRRRWSAPAIPRRVDLYDDGKKDDFTLEWSNAMAHLREVERLRDASEPTDDQEREYGSARAHAAEPLPTIKRLELSEPGVPLD